MTCLVLVEDHPIMRETAEQLLRDHFAEASVHSFADAESALAFCTATPVDVVITDIALPGMSGMALLEVLSRQQPQLPVIVETLYDFPEHQQMAQLFHAYRLLSKSDMATALVPAVRAALQQREVK